MEFDQIGIGVEGMHDTRQPMGTIQLLLDLKATRNTFGHILSHLAVDLVPPADRGHYTVR